MHYISHCILFTLSSQCGTDQYWESLFLQWKVLMTGENAIQCYMIQHHEMICVFPSECLQALHRHSDWDHILSFSEMFKSRNSELQFCHVAVSSIYWINCHRSGREMFLHPSWLFLLRNRPRYRMISLLAQISRSIVPLFSDLKILMCKAWNFIWLAFKIQGTVARWKKKRKKHWF